MTTKIEALHFVNGCRMAKTDLKPFYTEDNFAEPFPLSLIVNYNSNVIPVFESKINNSNTEVLDNNYVLSSGHFLSERNMKKGVEQE